MRCKFKTPCSKDVLEKSMVSVKKGHFSKLRVIPALLRTVRTLRTLTMSSACEIEKITLCSRYTRPNCHLAAENMISILRLKVQRGFQSPKGTWIKVYDS